MRIAFNLIPSAKWTGGYNYLVNLFHAVQQYQSGNIQPVLFCGEDAADQDLQPFMVMKGVDIVRSAVFDEDRKGLRLMRSLLAKADRAALPLFVEQHIDVIFENAAFYGWRFPIPVIAWMPDFQHRRLREQFGFASYWRRELGFRAQVASGRILMLSSEDARSDCERFYPGAVGHTAVVRFAAPIPADLLEERPETALRTYHLPEKFLYLPNQFWKHKNHDVVVEALGLLKQQGHRVIVAASGNPNDPRHPEYLVQLQARIATLGLQDHFIMLGLIPRRHVMSLLRICSALINPSYFEGWSSTVEEARTLGTPMLLSDIAVHREQMGSVARYFSPDDVQSLADGMLAMVRQAPRSIQVEFKPEELGAANVQRFANDFMTVAEQAVQSGGRPIAK